jgi:hypothetical protein
MHGAMDRRTLIIAGGAAALGALGADLVLRDRRSATPQPPAAPPASPIETTASIDLPTRDLIDGIVWQPLASMLDPHGEWQRLGAQTLMMQWTVLDGVSFIPNLLDLPTIEDAPNWRRIQREPWARKIIMGLASYGNEPNARRDVAQLAALSAKVARARLPFKPSAYYFPVEIDPTWQGAAQIGPLLADIPRPLWVSCYDNSNVGGAALGDWLASFLPKDVGVMLQDGLGGHMRTAESARQYVEALRVRLGPERVALIPEAFRPDGSGGLRAATAQELRPQLDTYRGIETYVFEGPHYLTRRIIRQLTEG